MKARAGSLFDVRIRQSDLKTWGQCPLQYRFSRTEGVPREQGAALTFGTIVHECVLYLETTGDLDGALDRFRAWWADPEAKDPELSIDFFHRGATFARYARDGERLLKDWASLIQWDTDTVLGRELHFIVPIGNAGNELEGTIDKLVMRYHPKLDRHTITVVDYKTSKNPPTYGYLAQDLQFTAYCYATTRPELWKNIPNGAQLFSQYRDLPRYGEWVQLKGPKRMDAGIREDYQYRRLAYAVDAMVDSISLGIFVPTISGDTCLFCPYRKTCGLKPLEKEENDVAQKFSTTP